MSVPSFDLPRLLAPMDADEFFRAYWQQKPLHIPRNDPAFYRGLVSLEQIDNLIACNIRKPDFTISIIGAEGVTHHQGRGGKPNAVSLDSTTVYKAFATGATLRIYAIEQYLDTVRGLAADVERRVNTEVRVNMYLTPRNAQGLPKHLDHHDVLILQTAGCKHWKVYGDPSDLPLQRVVKGRQSVFNRGSTFTPAHAGNGQAVLYDIVLNPGDLLYIPRGFLHEARTSDSLSMHLTVGFFVFTWHDAVVHTLHTMLHNNRVLRQALPPGFAVGRPDPQILADLSEQAAQAVCKHLSAEKIRESLEAIALNLAWSRSGLFTGYLNDLDHIEEINPDTVVALRPTVLHRLLVEKEHLTLVYGGRSLHLPTRTEPILRYILNAETFKVGDLPETLSANSKLVLVRQLVRNGLLTIVQLNGKPAPKSSGLSKIET